MAKSLRVHIPQPCHENWNEMTPSEQGAFCKSCQKHVVDFTTKTENEIFETLTSSNKVCGRFTSVQLQHPIRKTEIHRSFFSPRTIAASIMAFFSVERISASTDTLPDSVITQQLSTIDTALATQEICEENPPIDTCAEVAATEDTLHVKNEQPECFPIMISGDICINVLGGVGWVEVEIDPMLPKLTEAGTFEKPQFDPLINHKPYKITGGKITIPGQRQQLPLLAAFFNQRKRRLYSMVRAAFGRG